MSVHFHTIVVKISYKKSYKELVNKDTIKWERFGSLNVKVIDGWSLTKFDKGMDDAGCSLIWVTLSRNG